jgi:HPt (histidine-containing phosphotransfer) domain-containing protein
MKEMFLENGFDDYLAKPIEIPKLDKIMDKWIPTDKKVMGAAQQKEQADRNTVVTFAKLSELDKFGIDVAKGVMMTGGTMEGYRRVLALFVRDAEERLNAFQPLLDRQPSSGELDAFTISVHALKTASGTIGAAALSDEAKKLEEAGKAGDIALIKRNLVVFCEHLKVTIGALNGQIQKNALAFASMDKTPTVNAETYRDQFAELAAALADEDIGGIDRLLAQLEKINFDAKLKKLLADVSDTVLMGEFTAGIKILEGLVYGK